MAQDAAICPFRSECCDDRVRCEARGLCVHAAVAPIDFLMAGVRPALHFVGFRDPQRWENAVRVFGQPDVVHHTWDQRAQREIAYGWDRVVFAKGDETFRPSPYNYDDSNEPDDPAAKERD